MARSYKHTEKFISLQGEGKHTGANTIWLRFFSCNLECQGFGQPEPANPDTYFPVGQNIDVTNIATIEDVPMHEYGCDSAYSVAKQFRNLAYSNTAEEIAADLTTMLANDYNPAGKFNNPHSKMDTHMAFTGGEPMMQQRGIVEIMREFARQDNLPSNITIETNGTRPLSDDLADFIVEGETAHEFGGLYPDDVNMNWFWSVSPKLLHVSGEESKKAIKPEVVAEYAKYGTGQLKFVMNDDPTAWRELHKAIAAYRAVGVNWPVYIMPEGGLKEQQETERTRKIVNRALYEGFYVSGRLHTYLFGNQHNT